MKFFLEEEVEVDGEKTTQKVKEVVDEVQAVKDKTLKKCFIHTCYHDEGRGRPCKRREL